ncbi:MAG TPA: T9SS type A sorting domain-containing protein, partial [Ignavibacteriaceae bacterium]|nr:T9SS type A sorting domain-containing protein [Ignavibacteriaceae bacterium]
SISKKIFDRDTTGYYSFSVDSVSGVVIDVDEFDWAIPGNGIVIWHIDEKIISEKWASNEINANKDLRGVDVEEADGIQDIGRQFQTIFGDIVVGEGTYEDFWFQKNDAKLYKNVFDDKSTPNTSSNSGGKSLVSFSEFSDSTNVMSFRISFGDLSVKPLFNYSTNLTGELKELKVFTKAQTDYYTYRENDNVKMVSSKDKSVISLNNFSEKEFSLFNQGNNTFVIGVKGSIVNYFLMNDTIATFTHDYGEVFSSAPSIIKNISEQAKIYLGTESGKLLQIDLNTVSASFNGLLNSQSLSSQPIKSVSLNGNNFGVIAQRVLPNRENSTYEYYDNSGNSFNGVGEVIQFSSTKNNSGEDVIILLLDKNRFNIYVSGKLETIIDSKWGSVNSFGIGDLKNDGNNYIVFTANNNLIAMNINGVIADNFPLKLNDASKFLNPIRIADFSGDSNAEVVAQADNGNLYSIDGTSGKITEGFPIAIDVSTFHTGNFFEHENKSAFANFSQSGNLSSWIISDSKGSFYWNGNSGCNQNTNFVASASVASSINSFFPKNKAYNYPNPVYESETFIRYFISEDSKINIKIFDISGDLVDELSGSGRGGFDNEISWNVKNIQSGVYLARIEAQSNSDKKESAIIKIAVVK